MTVAYVDTSALVAIAFGEPSGDAMAQRLIEFTTMLSSNLLEAELRSAYSRERRHFEADRVSRVEWVMPDSAAVSRRLPLCWTPVYMRGAAVWHMATALYVAPDPSNMYFMTLDKRQRATASVLGFRT